MHMQAGCASPAAATAVCADGTADGDYTVETDLSAAGTCDGLIGDMPTIKNVMQYATSRGIVVPDAPEYMPSSAPVTGNAPGSNARTISVCPPVIVAIGAFRVAVSALSPTPRVTGKTPSAPSCVPATTHGPARWSETHRTR